MDNFVQTSCELEHPSRNNPQVHSDMPMFSSLKPKAQGKEKKKEIPSGFDWSHAKTALDITANIAEGTGLTPLKSAAGTVKKIVEIAETIKKNKESCVNIAKYSFELIEELKETLADKNPEEVDQTLLKSVKILEKELDHVKDKLDNIAGRNLGKKIIYSGADKEAISDCEKRIKQQLEKFNTVGIANLQQRQKDIQDKFTRIEKKYNQQEITSDQLEQATPAVPRIFFGREILIKEGADYVINNAQAFLAILGPGGIGKTALAQKIIEVEAIKEKFEKRSYFIPCDILPNVASLVQGLLQCLKIPTQEGKSQAEMLNDYFQLNARHTLLVLDNFETLWDGKEGRAGIQNFVEKLFNFKYVSILVTMRGRDGPGNIGWYKLGTESGIPPLSIDAARKMFFTITGNKSDLLEKTESIDKLLKELDYVPLAIRLIAQRARTSQLETLLRMWKDGKTSILKEGKGGFSRSTSVECSIQLSWIKEVVNNKSNMNKELELHILNITKIINTEIGKLVKQEHIDVIEILGEAYMFYGAVVEVIDNILVNVQDISTNQKNSLQFIKVDMLIWNAQWIEAEGEVRRIRGNNELNNKNNTAQWFERLRKICRLQARDSGAMATQCLRRLGNMHQMQNRYSEAAEIFSQAKSQFEEIGDQLGAAQCLQSLGVIHQMQDRYGEATEMLSMAKSQFEEIGNQLGAAQCLQTLGKIHQMQNRYSEATEMLSKAKSQFEEIGSQLGAAQCLRSLGEIHQMQDRYSEATEMLSKAKSQFEEIGDQLGATQCLQSLGEIHQMQDRYSEATEMLSKAKSQFEEIGDQLGAAQCLQSLGEIHQMQDRYSEATEILSKAKSQFEQIGYQLGAAQCLQSLGEIHQMQDRYSEATEMLSKAKSQFEEIGDQLGATQCLQSLGKIHQMQDRYSEATEILSKAKSQFEQIGNQLGAAQCLKSLGQIHQMQDRYSEATEMLSKAKSQFEEIGNQLGAAQCLQSLGEIHQMQDRYSEATEMLSKAKSQFEQIGDQLGTAQCLQSLGEIHQMQDRYSEATEMLSKAKSQFEEIGDQLGAAQCLQILGEIHQMQDRYSEATEMLSKAKTQFEQIGLQQEASQCLQSLEDIQRRR
ncbi:TPR-like protein [Dendrothele bispora CBS 962.96]|uniref:TPR-like protein n=1 Tax=Dendrothele bispora (strain CBS 962.96) TaxID=1314807 RepID=A0A4S8LVS3_DENBC|nr:TPR-like protein [Dendrothele bispora CBS 962.96]